MDNKVIGQRIRAAQEATHITQEELGNAVGCTAKHIGAIERGIKTPSLDTFIIIVNTIGALADFLLQDVLDCPVDSLAGEFSAAVAPLSPQMQTTFTSALKELPEEIRKLIEGVTEFYSYLETAGYKMAHYFSFRLADHFLPFVVPGYTCDQVNTIQYSGELKRYLQIVLDRME